jgi:hypothetical protein
MLSTKTKKQALKVKKIADNSNPKRSNAKESNTEGTYGINLNTRALSS